jgi:hypothetical protein
VIAIDKPASFTTNGQGCFQQLKPWQLSIARPNRFGEIRKKG